MIRPRKNTKAGWRYRTKEHYQFNNGNALATGRKKKEALDAYDNSLKGLKHLQKKASLQQRG